MTQRKNCNETLPIDRVLKSDRVSNLVGGAKTPCKQAAYLARLVIQVDYERLRL